MNKFKVGDRIEVTRNVEKGNRIGFFTRAEGTYPPLNAIGTIRSITHWGEGVNREYGIDWDGDGYEKFGGDLVREWQIEIVGIRNENSDIVIRGGEVKS